MSRPSRKRFKSSGDGDGSGDGSCSGSSGSSADPVPVCIIHFPDSSCAQFMLLSEVQDPEARLKKLQDIRTRRLGEPVDSSNRLPHICSQVPTALSVGHGYHRDCYQKFTGNLHRLKDNKSPTTTSDARHSSRASMVDKFLFQPDCIFCGSGGRKKVKKGKAWTSETLSKFEFGGGETVLNAAEKKEDHDLLRRIRGYDLFACEAQFHASCRKRYTTEPQLWRSHDPSNKLEQQNLEAAHNSAYHQVCQEIDKRLIQKKGMLKLSYLLDKYKQALQNTPYENPDYRAENLKRKLNKSYTDSLSFVSLAKKGPFRSSVVYSSSIDVDTLVCMTYELSIADKVQDAASDLRGSILSAYQEAKSLQWPPTAQQLEETDSMLPEELVRFLWYVITGHDKDDSSRVNRLVQSIGQDLCRAVTNAQWKLPKHIMLCMTLRHLFRSKELVTLINRFGHCENYSFALELETALATTVQASSHLLTSQIVRHPEGETLFHSDFDNFDQNTAVASIHTAHGIMLQEVDEAQKTTLPMPSLEKSKQRSLHLYPDMNQMPDCYVSTRKSPSYKISQWICPEGQDAEKAADSYNTLWVFTRWHSTNRSQEVPSWSGFISATGDPPVTTTTIDYYPVINAPITDYKTIQQCLKYSEQATHEVGQKYVITTFDLGVCMKAYPLVWNNSALYDEHIIMIGSFHVVCAYLKMIGKKMNGTGLSDILTEAGLVTSGSVAGVLAGKQYSRAMTSHKTLLEALERLMLEKFLEGSNRSSLVDTLTDEPTELIQELLETPSSKSLNDASTNEEIIQLMAEYCVFKQKIRDGQFGKTARLWMSYVDHIWLILKLIYAVKTNNFALYCACLYKMSDLFFSFDGHNYSRYLTFFSVFLANVEESHPGATRLLQNGAFSVARSLIPGNRCPVDKTIEETFMKYAKSRGGSGGCGAGVIGLVNDPNTYQRWVRTTHERAQYVEATFSMADMLAESRGNKKHRDLRPAEVKKSETMVSRAVAAVTSFINPFDVSDPEKLYCLSSDAAVDSDVERSVLGAEKVGKDAKENFIRDRLEKKDHFFEPIKKMKLKTMSDSHKTAQIKTKSNKIIEFKQQSTVMLNLLVRVQQGADVDIEDIMKYPLTPVPFALGTADGFLTKTDKSKGLHYLSKDVDTADVPPQDTTMIIEDGNALYYYMREVPNNFKEISYKVFEVMGKNSDVVFSTDMYLPASIKAMERQRRGCGEKRIIKGEMTRKPANWKEFLTNAENKKQLGQIIFNVWRSNEFCGYLGEQKVIFILEGDAFKLQAGENGTTECMPVASLKSNQEETDTRVVLYCKYAEDNGYDYVRVRSPDTDIFFILLHYVHELKVKVLFDTGTGNRRRLLDVSDMAKDFTREYATALTALHVYTHCDTTSAFKGVGKVKPIKVLQKNPKYQRILSQLGESWDASENLLSGLEEFTCALYGRQRFRSIDKLRYTLVKEKCTSEDGSIKINKNIQLSSLPPCSRALVQHIHRANYQMAIWRRAHIPVLDIPSPTDNHGWQMNDGTLEPLWFQGDFVPLVVADSVACDVTEENSDSDSDEDIGDELSVDDLFADSSDSDNDI